MLPEEEQHLIEFATRRLAERHPDLPLAAVSDAVAQARQHFAGRPIRDFVPLLVERNAEARLTHSKTQTTTVDSDTMSAGATGPPRVENRAPAGRHRKV